MSETLRKMTCKDLQALCITHNLKKSGTKSDLVARLEPILNSKSAMTDGLVVDILVGTMSGMKLVENEEMDVEEFIVEESEYPMIHELATQIAQRFFSIQDKRERDVFIKECAKKVRKGIQKRREQIALAIWLVFTIETRDETEEWRKKAIVESLIRNGREKF
jgi:hypothetical protein